MSQSERADPWPARIVIALVLLWATAFVGSFVAFMLTEPTDMGLTRGLNRIETFVGWQLGALGAALVTAIMAGRVRHGRRSRWLGFLPLWISGLFILATVSLFLLVTVILN